MRFLNTFSVVLFVSLYFTTYSQVAEPHIEETINQEIWKPFKKSYERRDWQAFNNLHTDDVLRVNPWGIRSGDIYKSSMKKSFSQNSGPARTIDFSFIDRVYADGIGYETGFYRVSGGHDKETYFEDFGYFHVLLKRVEGTWKIYVDWDTDNLLGKKISPEDFEKGEIPDLSY